MSFTCPVCQMTSHNPNDEQFQYCGRCHEFTGDTSEECILVSLPVERVPFAAPGTLRVLADCGHQVYLAPSSQRLLKRPNVKVLCGDCMEPMPDAINALPPGGMEEIRGMGGTVDEVIEMLRTFYK